MIEIGELLHRRSDLSTFVVHLTKDATAGSPAARDNLFTILRDRTLHAGEPMGWAHTEATTAGGAALDSQRVVCFTETPLEHLYGMFAEIRGRSVKLRGYGLAFTKVTARGMGINPVWYIDMTPGRTWEMAHGWTSSARRPSATASIKTPPAACSHSSRGWATGAERAGASRNSGGSESGAIAGTSRSGCRMWRS